ncbi:MAG TPA: hypothetical protein ENI27_08305 [bacterium]|nr:hypothetical protein [bacterium]
MHVDFMKIGSHIGPNDFEKSKVIWSGDLSEIPRHGESVRFKGHDYRVQSCLWEIVPDPEMVESGYVSEIPNVCIYIS